MALPVPPSKNQPIPNNPFYYPEGNFLYGDTGHLIVGAGLSIDYTSGVISASGGGGGVSSILAGTGINVSSSTGNVTITNTGVTSISTGLGLSGGPITSTGTITLDNTGVNPGNYTLANITVDAQGRISAASNGTAVLSVTGTAPVNVTAGTNPAISIAASSTTSPGIVQLNNTLTSNSITEALTAAQGQILQNQINALSVATNLTFAGTFDATLAHMDSVTTEGAAEGFALGANLPTPVASNDNFFVIVTVEGSYSPPGGGGPYSANRGDWFLSNGTTWEYLNVGADLPVATTGNQGIVELATVAEAQAGTSTTLAVTPAGLAASFPFATPTTCGLLYGCSTNTTQPITALGYGSLASLTTGCGNTAIGHCSQPVNSVGSSNTSIGACSLYSMTGVNGRNVAIGECTLYGVVDPAFNVAVGNCALAFLPSGDGNVAIGQIAMARYCTHSSASVAVGQTALYEGGGSFNVGVGLQALRYATGGCNTSLGANSALNLRTGGNNLVLGWCSCTAAAGSSNSVTLGNSLITVLRAAVTTITSLSDARDKTNVTALPVGLDFVNSLSPVKFTWQQREPNEVKDGTTEAGFIAQELQAAEAEHNADYLGLVYDENPEKLEASPGKLIPVLVKAIQELSAKVDELEAKLEANG